MDCPFCHTFIEAFHRTCPNCGGDMDQIDLKCWVWIDNEFHTSLATISMGAFNRLRRSNGAVHVIRVDMHLEMDNGDDADISEIKDVLVVYHTPQEWRESS